MIRPILTSGLLLGLIACAEPQEVINTAPTANPYQTNNMVLSLAVDAQTSSENLSYSWVLLNDGTLLGDSQNLDITSFVDQYEGEQIVLLSVSDGVNVYSQNFTVDFGVTSDVDNPPTAKFNSSVLSGVVPLNVTFDASGSSDDKLISEYSWSINNEDIPGKKIDYQFDVANNYVVILTVMDSSGQTHSAEQIISATQVGVDNFPVARYIVNNDSPTIVDGQPVTVIFDASTSSDDGTIASYSWQVNNQTSSDSKPSFNFTEPGTFNVSLTVTDNIGQTHSVNDTIVVGELTNVPESISIQASTTSAIAPASITFSTNGSLISEPNPVYVWRINNNTLNEQSNSLTHEFTQAGNFEVIVSTTNQKNEIISNQISVSITPAVVVNIKPTADIDADTTSGVAPLAVNFNANNATDSDGSVAGYKWIVNGVTQGTNNSFTQMYNTPGTYTVSLVVTDNEGLDSDQVSQSITVTQGNNALPICDMADDTNPYCKADFSTDDNDDGWGWENEASCIFVDGPADPNPGSCELEVITPGAGNSSNRITYMGQPLYLSGFNIAWFGFAGDVGNGVDTNQLRQAIADLKQAGGNTLRWWIHTDGSLTPAWNNGLISGPGNNFITDMTTALDIALEEGVYIVPSLWSFDMLNGNAFRNPPVDDNYNLLTQNNVLQSYLDNALVPMVTQLNDHPALVAWELFNEPENMTESWFADRDTVNTNQANALTLEHIQVATAKMAATIHQTAIDNGQVALVTTGSKSMGKYNSDVAGGTNLYSDAALMALNNNDPLSVLDFYQPHYYNNEGKQGDWSPFHHDASYWNVDKPIVVGEFYVNDGLKNNNSQPLKAQYEDLNTEDMCLKLVEGGYAGGWAWQWNEYAAEIKSCLNPINIDLGPGSDEIMQ
ncbi:PKD domain-containing protein [Marinicellulosiphila megalodicopiae]|uniref:PKD domain-containing protein n=1 Tax=Marinicellulosiphila megalodicopiae TaxID=2724896 RepID=UPI003BB214A8